MFLYVALGVVAVGVIVLVVRSLGGGDRRRLPPVDPFAQRRDPFAQRRGPERAPESEPEPVEEELDVGRLRGEILELLRRGDEYGAVDHYRRRTGCSKSDARYAVAEIGAELPHVAPAPPAARERDVAPPISLQPALLAECEALGRTDKIGAIKRWREVTHAPLKASKDLVEALVRDGAPNVPPALLQAAWPGGEEPSGEPYTEPARYPPAKPSFEAPPVTADENAALLAECVSMARRGDKIGAIKKYRERTGAGLRDAKDAVERALGERS